MTVTVELINQGSLNLLKDMANLGLIHLHTSTQQSTGETAQQNKPAPAFESHPCPICKEKFQDPVTGEMRYGPKTMAGMKEVDDMLAGKIPNTLKSFNSFEEMLADLNSDDDEDEE